MGGEPQQQQRDLYQPEVYVYPNQSVVLHDDTPSVVSRLIDEARGAMGDWLFLGIFLAGVISLWGGQISLKKLRKVKQAWQSESSQNIKTVAVLILALGLSGCTPKPSGVSYMMHIDTEEEYDGSTLMASWDLQ